MPVVTTRIAAERGLRMAQGVWKAHRTAAPTGHTILFAGSQGGTAILLSLGLLVALARRAHRRLGSPREGGHDEGPGASPKGKTPPRLSLLHRLVGVADACRLCCVRFVLPVALLLLPWRVVRSVSRVLLRRQRASADDENPSPLARAATAASASEGGGRHRRVPSAGALGAMAVELGELKGEQPAVQLQREQLEQQRKQHLLAVDRMYASSLPDLLGSTSQPPSVLPSEARLFLRRALPLRLRPCDWALLYSTEQHGCSLRTMLTRLEARGPTLLVVLDALGHLFGAFVSEDVRADGHYFGNGETFLFRVLPTLERYEWTRHDSHFVLAAQDCVAFGGGGAGNFALCLDSSLEFGSSHPSPTFGSQCLAGGPDFKVIKVEVWGFV